MIEDNGSISPPFDDFWIVLTVIDPEGMTLIFDASTKLPWKSNTEAPFPLSPSVTMYFTVMTELFSNFLPK